MRLADSVRHLCDVAESELPPLGPCSLLLSQHCVADRMPRWSHGMNDPVRIKPYTGPAGGWGSAKSLTEILLREQIPLSGGTMLMQQNKPDGFMCVSCAWAKPSKPNLF